MGKYLLEINTHASEYSALYYSVMLVNATTSLFHIQIDPPLNIMSDKNDDGGGGYSIIINYMLA
jgi:hypothetical protein